MDLINPKTVGIKWFFIQLRNATERTRLLKQQLSEVFKYEGISQNSES